jgi:DNA-binding GntR family transcriptional regulator
MGFTMELVEAKKLKQNLVQTVVATLREQLFEGVYGPGVHLALDDLAKQFNSSTVPIREALRNLQAEELVVFHPNRGAYVKQLSFAEMRELFFIRIPLEEVAATEAALRWTDEKQLQALSGLLDQMDLTCNSAAWHRLHAEFHRRLYELADMPRVNRLIVLFRGQMRLYTKQCLSEPEHMRQAQREHREILSCMRERDTKRMKRLIRAHLVKVARKLATILGEGHDLALDTLGDDDRE